MNQNFSTILKADEIKRQYWRDLWTYRELFYFLSWKDILVRYKQTVIGVAWSVIRPLSTMVVFTTVFGKIAKLPSESSVPYGLMVFAALLPWQFFANAIQECGNSLVINVNLVSKVFFPRLIIPTSAIIVCLVDFLISMVLFIGVMIFYRFVPSWTVVLMPLFLLLATVFALGIGLWLAALNVKYRDFRYIIPFIVQFGLYLSPVGFSSSIVPDKWKLLFAFNPMVGIIDGFRWSIMGPDRAPLSMVSIGLSVFLSAAIFYTGLAYFRKTEATFADII